MVDKEKSKVIETIPKLIDINKIPKIDSKDITVKSQSWDYMKGIYKGDKVIIKEIFNEDLEYFVHDKDFIFSKLHHECIPEFYGVIIGRESISTVHKYISGKSLYDIRLTDFDEKQKIKVIKSLSNVLLYIHSNNFIHGYLDPENIIIDSNWNIFLINFGIARLMETYSGRGGARFKLKTNFCSPDMIDITEKSDRFEELYNTLSSKVDIWAYGCIVSYLFSEKLPWCNVFMENPQIIHKLLLKKKIPFPVPVKEILKKEYTCTDEIIDIITKCTIYDQTKRSNMTEIKAITDIL